MGQEGRCAKALNVSPNGTALRRLHAGSVKFSLEKPRFEAEPGQASAKTGDALPGFVPELQPAFLPSPSPPLGFWFSSG